MRYAAFLLAVLMISLMAFAQTPQNQGAAQGQVGKELPARSPISARRALFRRPAISLAASFKAMDASGLPAPAMPACTRSSRVICHNTCTTSLRERLSAVEARRVR